MQPTWVDDVSSLPVVETDFTDRRPAWARVLGLEPHSDDPDILQRYLHSSQVNHAEGYVADEVVVSYHPFSWGLGVEAEHIDLSGYKKAAWWRGLTLRVGPFSLTASRQSSEEL